MPSTLIDPFSRKMDYLRLAVTDKCNLRCQYCMPAGGIPFMPEASFLTFTEMSRLLGIFVSLGVKKVRFTGGEPLLRKGVLDFLAEIRQTMPALGIGITTNGMLLKRALPRLEEIGVRRLNISLDSLDPITFETITRRPGVHKVLEAIDDAVAGRFQVKINSVVLKGLNEDKLPDLAKLAQDKKIEVRFIEAMPFSGGKNFGAEVISAVEIRRRLSQVFSMKPVPMASSDVAQRYRIHGFAGTVGIIAGYSRTFCDGCSRLRLSANGKLRTCLYGNEVVNLKNLISGGADDAEICTAIQQAVSRRYRDGEEAEKSSPNHASMATIGG